MKRYISILMIFCFASFSFAQNNYDAQWKKIAKLEKEGLTKSVSEVVETIYNQAITENNDQQRIKALLHKSKYLLILNEEAQFNIVNLFKTEIEKSKSIVAKRLLENMLATMYWQYFQQNRYTFYNRSKTAVKVSDDFRTWDLKTLFSEIHFYYQQSLKNGIILQQEKLDNYKNLIIEVENSKDYRPTLFDLLSHNALEFYKTDENSISQPAYKFLIDNTKFIAPREKFINLDIVAKDTSSLQLNALKIYQQLLKFHRKNKSSKAFASVDIERLNFVLEHATFQNKEELLLNTLTDTAESLKSSPISALYNFEIASLYKKLGNTYNSSTIQDAKNATHRWKLKEALNLCNEVISNYPDSDGANKCKLLKKQILLPSLKLLTEEFIPINTPSRLLVTYKNLDTLNFKLYKVSKEQLTRFNKIYRANEKEAFFQTLDSFESFSSSLKSEGDYQEHSTEIVLPRLKNGLYLIRANVNNTKQVFATTHIQVTNLALIQSIEDNNYIYQLIDRNNGKPYTNANISLSYIQNRDNKQKTKHFTTDKYGKVAFKKDDNYYRNVDITAIVKNDTGHFGSFYFQKNYKQNEPIGTTYSSFVFTDRSIYRPGQTVFFKGILTSTKHDKTQVLSNATVTAELYNVNGEKLSEYKYVSNEYGSFHGEFILPNSGLTGDYFIRIYSDKVTRNQMFFSVEEYKRPKFKPQFQPITDTYTVNDSITVNGTAVAFSGSNITNAKVIYRVKRMVQYPIWYYWRRPYFNIEPQEITFGETKSNSNGEFEITFKALPDESVLKDNLPVFNYEVTADITDINGETRSATTIVSVGYHALTLTINVPKEIDKFNKDIEIPISSNNLNGETVTVKGNLKVYKLVAPDKVLRSRAWPAPDYQTMTKENYKKLFPNDPYTNEDDIMNWNKGKLVFNTNFDTEYKKVISLKDVKNWSSGNYLVVAQSEDKFGQLVKDEKIVRLFSNKDNIVSDYQLFQAQLDNSSYKPGEVAKLSIGSAAKNISVTVEIIKDNNINSTQIIKLNNSIKIISIPVSRDDLGGFEVNCSFAAYNGYTSQSLIIAVPYPNTDLSIESSTFRDKIKPGEEETWSFKIKGPKGDKISAELLASMYDASLDEFKPHEWSFNPILDPSNYGRINKNSRQSFGTINFNVFNNVYTISRFPNQRFDQLNWFGFYFGINSRLTLRSKSYSVDNAMAVEDATELEEVGFASTGGGDLGSRSSSDTENASNKSKDVVNNPIKIRANFNETAFFFPQLKTDSEGQVTFSFTTPEALTQWKLQLLAHTKSLESSVAQFNTVTQKELMVIPNAPRFLREGDTISISTKIANLTDKTLSGNAWLELTNALTGESINDILDNLNSEISFTVDAKGNTQISWHITIPKGVQAIQYKIIAKSGEFSDGEQNVLPVLTKRMLVTESLAMWVKSNQTKTFTLDKLKTNSSPSLKHHKLTLEITSNPAWYAVQALPYLMEYPYDCNEQIYSRYYANALAQHIVKSNPKIEAVFNQWKSTEALLSNLEKNQELKYLLIEETPWLRDAQSEKEQKKRIALLFDLNKMANELQTAQGKLQNNQMPSGAWAWFNGGSDNRYITQHIVAGFGHLKQLNVSDNTKVSAMIHNAINYLDDQFVKEYNNLKKHANKIDVDKDQLSHMQLHYLYVRSFYPEIALSDEAQTIKEFYKNQIKMYWLKQTLYDKGLMALAMQRMQETATADKIIKSLKENSITTEELGMYWIENTNSWHWYKAPIETQALLIEAFSEIDKDKTTIDNLKIWLLKHKQTNQWKTTKATTEAVYALLLQGSKWLDVTELVDVKVGNEVISPSSLDNLKLEAGTGYYKTSWNRSEIQPEMAEVTLSKKGDGIAWGALNWQYFEDLDKITSAETPLKLSKKLFLKTNTDKGEEISEITSDTPLIVGDLIRVRIELRTDRSMEFVHLKDMRAAGLEPINVLSQYKWLDGLGYYESTKDAATNFFIDYLPKGVYVFEYDLRVNNAGNMSNGISTIQSMYAPEFSSHSEGVRLNVKN